MHIEGYSNVHIITSIR